jgi:hypothetical protein
MRVLLLMLIPLLGMSILWKLANQVENSDTDDKICMSCIFGGFGERSGWSC